MKKWMALVVVLLLLLSGCGKEPMTVEEKKDVLMEEGAVRIMSFNIRCAEYEERQELVPQLILEYAPDSVGVQECTYQWYKQLTGVLTGYGFVGVGRDTGDVHFGCGELSGVLYRLDKYELLDSGTIWVSETPEKVSYGWDAACRRVCTWAVLRNLETGESYVHVNTHLDHQGEVARSKGVELVVEKVRSFDLPVVLTGDFNFDQGADPYWKVLDAGLLDTKFQTEDSMDGKTFHAYQGGEEGLPIDFIFVNDQVGCIIRTRILRDIYGEQYPSDHYPIYADLYLLGA